MKKTLFLTLVSALALLISSSCSKQDRPVKETTYTFSIFTSGLEVYLSEHNIVGDRIHTTIIDNAEANVPYSFIAKDNTVKIKVYLKHTHWNKWVQQIYYLNEGKNIDIIITGDTIIGNYEP